MAAEEKYYFYLQPVEEHGGKSMDFVVQIWILALYFLYGFT
jgi:hypothetical protein